MPKCIVKGCKNRSSKMKKQDGITFHAFPNRDQFTKKKWIAAICENRREPSWQPQIWDVVCSAHFYNEDFYDTKNGLRRVIKGRFPKNSLNPLPTTSTSASNMSEEEEENVCNEAEVLEVPVVDPPVLLTSVPLEPKIPTCSECGIEMNGFQYFCVQCEEFEMCGMCCTGGAHAHHYVIRVPKDQTQWKVRYIVVAVRRIIITAESLSNYSRFLVQPSMNEASPLAANTGHVQVEIDTGESMEESAFETTGIEQNIKVEFEASETETNTDREYVLEGSEVFLRTAIKIEPMEDETSTETTMDVTQENDPLKSPLSNEHHRVNSSDFRVQPIKEEVKEHITIEVERSTVTLDNHENDDLTSNNPPKLIRDLPSSENRKRGHSPDLESVQQIKEEESEQIATEECEMFSPSDTKNVSIEKKSAETKRKVILRKNVKLKSSKKS